MPVKVVCGLQTLFALDTRGVWDSSHLHSGGSWCLLTACDRVCGATLPQSHLPFPTPGDEYPFSLFLYIGVSLTAECLGHQLRGSGGYLKRTCSFPGRPGHLPLRVLWRIDLDSMTSACPAEPWGGNMQPAPGPLLTMEVQV